MQTTSELLVHSLGFRQGRKVRRARALRRT
jgi:hypothetical protein